MKVPLLDESVSRKPANVPEPRFSPVVEGAYGANVHDQRAKIGAGISQIGTVLANHLEQRLYWDSQEKAYEATAKYKSLQQDIMYGQGEKKVKDVSTGTDISLPSGLMTRKMQQATAVGGVTAEYDVRATAAKDEILRTLQNNPLARKTALRQIDTYIEAGRNSVISHEAKQDELGKIATFDSAANRAIADMAVTMDPKERQALIAGPGGIVESVMAMGAAAQWPQDKIDLLIDKKVAAAADVAVTSNLKMGGTEESAMQILDGIAGVAPKDYADLSMKVKTMAAKVARQNEVAYKVETDKNDKAFAERYVSKDPTAIISPAELEEARVKGAAGLPGGISSQLYQAIKAGQNPTKGTPEERNQAIQDLADIYSDVTDDAGYMDPDAKFGHIAEYKAALIKAKAVGAIGDREYLKKLNLIDATFDKGLDNEVNAAYGNVKTMKNYLWDAATYAVTQKPVKGGSAVDKTELAEARAFLSKRLMDRLAEGPVPPDQIHTVPQQILAEFIAMKNPNVLGAKAVPNNVGGKDGVKALHQMQVASNSDRSLAIKQAPAKQVDPTLFTEENIQYTAKVMNLTVDEVRKRLEAKKNAA
jgi:hypothetical protein